MKTDGFVQDVCIFLDEILSPHRPILYHIRIDMETNLDHILRMELMEQ
jgi:hypothetical protein